MEDSQYSTVEKPLLQISFWNQSSWTSSIVCVLTLILFGVYYIYIKDSHTRRMFSKIPSWHNWPLLGDVLHIPSTSSEWWATLLHLCEKNRGQGIFHVSMLSRHWVFLYGSGTVGELLKNTEYLTKASDYNFLHKWLGEGLLTSTGQKWHNRRKTLTPSFHFNILKDFLITMNEQAENLREKLASFADTGEAVDLFPVITLNSLDIISATAMGVQLDAIHNSESEYVKAVFVAGDGISLQMQLPWMWNEFLFKHFTSTGRRVTKSIEYMHQFTNKVITERRELFNASSLDQGNRKKAFLDMLLTCTDEEGQHLSFEEIREEVDTFMFEGHDTTSSGTAFALHLLAAHPEELYKCWQEQNEIFENPRETTMDDLRSMTYLEATIKESLRIFSPVPWFSRVANESINFAGHVLPKGTDLLILSKALHMDPTVFPDPQKFDPTRFLAENSRDRNPYAYVPFSAGIRNCIGQKFAMMELKMILSTVIRNFDITTTQSREELKQEPGLILNPTNGIWIKLSSR